MRFSLVAAVALSLFAGCQKSSSEKLREAGFDPVSRAHSFDAIAEDLNTLDDKVDRVDYTRVPADIIVDATKSTDHQPVEAVLTDLPEAPGKFAYLHVPRKNIDFKKSNVRPGDLVKYYVKPAGFDNQNQPGQTDATREIEANLGKREAIELSVVRVIDSATIEFEPPLNGPIEEPFAIVVSRATEFQQLATVLNPLAIWEQTGQPATGWQTTPDIDALDQLVIRLNTWLDSEETPPAWQADAMLAELPAVARPQYASVAAERFDRSDGRLLQEAVWLRDIARRTSATATVAEQAQQLFNWMLRNVQLDPPDSPFATAQRPWQALATGRGSADQRAWIFTLLMRQAGIDAVPLSVRADEHVWTVAVRSGDDWLLFDPALGLPIPAAGGTGIATLAQVKADPALLRQLDLDAKQTYPVDAAALGKLTALVEASPLYLSRRAHQIEAQLAGENRVVLSTSPSRIAGLIRPHVSVVKIWPIEWRTVVEAEQLPAAARHELARVYRAFILEPLLWKGRILQFRGNDRRTTLDYADRPVKVYTAARDPRVFYTLRCRPSDADLKELEEHQSLFVEELRLCKELATVWMGAASFDYADYAVALDYLSARSTAKKPNTPLAAVARFTLAQTHERVAELLQRTVSDAAPPADVWSMLASPLAFAARSAAASELESAATIYEGDQSASRYGSLLRARALRRKLAL
jgi:hypothetical protein